MTIYLTAEELYTYHESHHIAEGADDTRKYISERGPSVIRFHDQKNSESLDINSLECDAEVFEQQVFDNREEILQDRSIQEYISSQRIHKANFLKEIAEKGLSLKSTKEENKPKTMNY